MSKYIDADALLDGMGKAARELDTEGITDVDDMLDAMEEAMRKCVYEMPAADMEPVRKWISVDERLPEPHTNVILCRPDADGNLITEQGFYCGDDWWKVFGTRTKKVIAWQNLPEPPKMDGGSEENVEPCVRKNIKRASNDNPCIGYGISEDNDETCDMCKACVNCETHVDDVEDGGSE